MKGIIASGVFYIICRNTNIIVCSTLQTFNASLKMRTFESVYNSPVLELYHSYNPNVFLTLLDVIDKNAFANGGRLLKKVNRFTAERR
jgi:hypothetical protein